MLTKGEKKIQASSTNQLAELLGPTLLVNTNGAQTPTSAVKQPLVLLYFSASWCSPCRTFSPILKDFYKLHQDKLEIVFVSSDQSVADFERYFAEMPWKAMTFESGAAQRKNRLAQLLQIQAIPNLIVLTNQGDFVAANGAVARVRTCMRAGATTGAAAYASLELVKEWQAAEPVDIANIPAARFGNSAGGGVMRIVSLLLRHPVGWFALIYLFKYLKLQYRKHVQESGGDSQQGATEL